MNGFLGLKNEIANQISGQVLDSSDKEYRSSLEIDNGRINHVPKLVVIPGADPQNVGQEDEEKRIWQLIEDVVRTVRICKREGLKLTVRSGGHSAAGYCMNSDGAVLDLRNLDWVQFDRESGSLRAGMGQRFSRIYHYLEETGTGRIPVGGGCPAVGLGGFLLGGGYSFVSRSYGLGADNVVRYRVVTADGAIRDVGRASSNPEDQELFWGLRGGGGGNFGVVVDAVLECPRPKEPKMMVGQIFFPFHRLEEILEFYNSWVVKLPREMAVYGYLGSQPEPQMNGDQALALRFTPIFNGPFADGVDCLRPLLKLRPTTVQLSSMTLPEWENLVGSSTVVKGRNAYMRSVVMNRGEMTADVSDVLKEYMRQRPSRDSFVVWTHAGGAIGDVKTGETAYPHREALFVPEVKAIWSGNKPEILRENVEWAHRFFDDLATYACGSYINYIDPLLRDWPERYYGDTYDQLVNLREKVDPDGFFSFQQSIGSEFRPSLHNKPLDIGPLQIT